MSAGSCVDMRYLHRSLHVGERPGRRQGPLEQKESGIVLRVEGCDGCLVLLPMCALRPLITYQPLCYPQVTGDACAHEPRAQGQAS
jgi:hypothetical protein